MKYLVTMLVLGLSACGQMPPAPSPANGGSGFFKGGDYPLSSLAEGGRPDRGGSDGNAGPGN